MPLMPRAKGKGKKVAYAILGTPANLIKRKKSEHERQVRERLTFEETRLSR